MHYLKKIFKPKYPKTVRLTPQNIDNWPSFLQKLEAGSVKFDRNDRLRYLHGAPVGDLILVRINNDGSPIYKESSEEWFDAESEMAENFIWP